MFHPIFNYDGKVSIFRVVCLTIFAFCLIIYGVLALTSNDSNDRSNAQAQVSNQQDDVIEDETFDEEDDDEYQQLVKNRRMMLIELKDTVAFLSSCGNINAGFEGCRVDFSEQFKRYYKASVEAFDDGFSISVEAINVQASDHCFKITVDSSLNVSVLDHKNQDITNKCVPNNYLKDLIDIPVARKTDHIESYLAPSGMDIIVKDVAQSK